MSTERINFKCQACGGDSFSHPSDPQPTDDVTCVGCGAVFKWADFQAAGERLKGELHEKLVGAFKGLKGWKTK